MPVGLRAYLVEEPVVGDLMIPSQRHRGGSDIVAAHLIVYGGAAVLGVPRSPEIRVVGAILAERVRLECENSVVFAFKVAFDRIGRFLQGRRQKLPVGFRVPCYLRIVRP